LLWVKSSSASGAEGDQPAVEDTPYRTWAEVDQQRAEGAFKDEAKERVVPVSVQNLCTVEQTWPQGVEKG